MSVDDTIKALKLRAFDDKGVTKIASEAGVHPDTIRSVLSDRPPGWLMTYRKLEAMAQAATATGAVETGGEA